MGLTSIYEKFPCSTQVLSIVDFSKTWKYSRTHEFLADEKGAHRMTGAGFDPDRMVTLLEKLSKESGQSDTLDRCCLMGKVQPAGCVRIDRRALLRGTSCTDERHYPLKIYDDWRAARELKVSGPFSYSFSDR
jgi:hypothetical protein